MTQQIIDILNSQSYASEAVEITHYSVYIGNREVLVTVRDQGAGAGSTRYAASAQWESTTDDAPDNARTNGNAAETIESAIDNIHWWNFTRGDD